MDLVFASQNRHKMEEIKPLLPDSIKLLCLTDLGFTDEIPETADTLAGNALQKAEFIVAKFPSLLLPGGAGLCFADDTGLEIEALGGRPGVYSARYAGEGKSAGDNIRKILEELEGVENRRAVFKTVIALAGLELPLYFEGIVKGIITKEKHGTGGFGYDPVFMPEGYNRTFAEMSLEEKNKLSHRGIAVGKFAAFLRENYPAV